MLESHAIEESSEWRSFSDSARLSDKERWEARSHAFRTSSPLQDKGNQVDPNRVGGPSNPLLPSGGLGTGISRDGDARTAACVAPLRPRVRRRELTRRRLVRMHTRGPDPDLCVRGALFFLRTCAA